MAPVGWIWIVTCCACYCCAACWEGLCGRFMGVATSITAVAAVGCCRCCCWCPLNQQHLALRTRQIPRTGCCPHRAAQLFCCVLCVVPSGASWLSGVLLPTGAYTSCFGGGVVQHRCGEWCGVMSLGVCVVPGSILAHTCLFSREAVDEMNSQHLQPCVPGACHGCVLGVCVGCGVTTGCAQVLFGLPAVTPGAQRV